MRRWMDKTKLPKRPTYLRASELQEYKKFIGEQFIEELEIALSQVTEAKENEKDRSGD